jgi:radical SAM protein with 4Fe4S-binding SPASM domain
MKLKYHERPFFLHELKIEVTHKCNLVCIHCSSDATPSCKREMLADRCLDILKQAAEMGVKEVAFSGGEPLLWPYIEDAVEVAVSCQMTVTLYTSGNVDNIDTCFYSLYSKGLRKAVFSLFGPDMKTHENITRVSGSYNKTLKAIENAQLAGLDTELHFVPFVSNYSSLQSLAELGERMGISKISVLRFVPQGRGQLLSGYTLNKLQNLELKRNIIKLRHAGYDIRTGSPYNFLMINKEPGCYSGINRLIVGPDLHLYPCDAFKQIEAEEIVGTIKLSSLDTETLEACWNESPYLEAVREYLTTDFCEPCKDCRSLEECLSGCLAQKIVAYGGLIKRQDPACLIS